MTTRSAGSSSWESLEWKGRVMWSPRDSGGSQTSPQSRALGVSLRVDKQL